MDKFQRGVGRKFFYHFMCIYRAYLLNSNHDKENDSWSKAKMRLNPMFFVDYFLNTPRLNFKAPMPD